MALITLTNDFHHTACRIRVNSGDVLSERRIRHIANNLCGIDGCVCGETSLATRGPQRTPDGELIGLEYTLRRSGDGYLITWPVDPA